MEYKSIINNYKLGFNVNYRSDYFMDQLNTHLALLKPLVKDEKIYFRNLNSLSNDIDSCKFIYSAYLDANVLGYINHYRYEDKYYNIEKVLNDIVTIKHSSYEDTKLVIYVPTLSASFRREVDSKIEHTDSFICDNRILHYLASKHYLIPFNYCDFCDYKKGGYINGIIYAKQLLSDVSFLDEINAINEGEN